MKRAIERLLAPHVLIHLIVLGGALAVVLVPGFSEAAQHWAYGTIGLVLGNFKNPP